MTPKFERFIVAADNHGHLGDEEAIGKILDFTADWKPKYRIHLGDLWDFSPLRRGASQEEKADGIADDYAMGIDFLDRFRPQFLTLGNHDDRIWQHAQHRTDGILRETCAELVTQSEKEFKKRKIAVVPYKIGSYLQMPAGGPKLMHGYRSSMYPAAAHFRDWGSCLHGHVHRPDAYAAPHADGGMSFSVSCLANLDSLSYADRNPSKMGWRVGFLYGLINSKTGAWNAWHVKKEAGSWLSPHGPL